MAHHRRGCAVDPLGGLRPRPGAGRGGARRRRAGHPHRRHGRPFRAGDHVRAQDGGGHRRRHPRPRRLRRRAPDDRAAGAAHLAVRGRRGRQHHRARRDVPTPALHAPADQRARLPRGPHPEPCNARRGDLRGRAVRRRPSVHERQPGLGRAVVHPGDARPAAAHPRAGGRGGGGRGGRRRGKAETAAGVYRAGANILVAGSAVFDSPSPAEAYAELVEVVAGAGAVAWR